MTRHHIIRLMTAISSGGDVTEGEADGETMVIAFFLPAFNHILASLQPLLLPPLTFSLPTFDLPPSFALDSNYQHHNHFAPLPSLTIPLSTIILPTHYHHHHHSHKKFFLLSLTYSSYLSSPTSTRVYTPFTFLLLPRLLSFLAVPSRVSSLHLSFHYPPPSLPYARGGDEPGSLPAKVISADHSRQLGVASGAVAGR